MLTSQYQKIKFLNTSPPFGQRTCFTFLFLFCSFTLAIACDICGNYMGITPYDNKNSISLLHRYRIFNGYVNHQSHGSFFPKSAYRVAHSNDPGDSIVTKNYSSHDFESYKILELRIKYFVGNRLELNLFLPFLDNKSRTDSRDMRNTGLGDISLYAGYHILTPKAEVRVRHKLILGAGIKLPTGNIAAGLKGERLPFEMQLGTGSTDVFGYFNYVLMTKKLGASLNLNYKINGANRYDERISNSFNNFISLFYKFNLKKLSVYPSIQGNYERTNGLMMKKVLKEGTKVNSMLLGPGLDLYYQAFSLNLAWQFTLAERVGAGNLKSTGRVSVGINYSFGKKEK